MRRWPLLLCWGLGACGREELDLLVPSAAPDPCVDFSSQAECDPFVRRVGQSFLLNGQNFRFVGVSSWALLQPAGCATVEPEEREAWFERAFDELVPSRSKVARAFAFQNTAGPRGDDFTLLDAAVLAARRAGVRLLLVLEHAGGSCSEGGHRNSAWYTTGYLDPDGDYSIAYRDYARSVAERYRDEPTVLGYVLVQDLGAGAEGADLDGFVRDMGQLLHGVAPNQLVSLDLAWPGPEPAKVERYRALQALPVVDFVDVDDYVLSEDPEPFDPRLLETLSGLEKPLVVGEGAFGLTGSDDAALALRGDQARKRARAWRQAGFSGGLFWAYQPGWQEVSEEFDARPADPLLQPGGVLASIPF